MSQPQHQQGGGVRIEAGELIAVVSDALNSTKPMGELPGPAGLALTSVNAVQRAKPQAWQPSRSIKIAWGGEGPSVAVGGEPSDLTPDEAYLLHQQIKTAFINGAPGSLDEMAMRELTTRGGLMQLIFRLYESTWNVVPTKRREERSAVVDLWRTVGNFAVLQRLRAVKNSYDKGYVISECSLWKPGSHKSISGRKAVKDPPEGWQQQVDDANPMAFPVCALDMRLLRELLGYEFVPADILAFTPDSLVPQKRSPGRGSRPMAESLATFGPEAAEQIAPTDLIGAVQLLLEGSKHFGLVVDSMNLTVVQASIKMARSPSSVELAYSPHPINKPDTVVSKIAGRPNLARRAWGEYERLYTSMLHGVPAEVWQATATKLIADGADTCRVTISAKRTAEQSDAIVVLERTLAGGRAKVVNRILASVGTGDEPEVTYHNECYAKLPDGQATRLDSVILARYEHVRLPLDAPLNREQWWRLLTKPLRKSDVAKPEGSTK